MALLNRSFLIAACFLMTLTFGSCTKPRESEEQRNADANSAAGKMGRAAHRVAVETEKAADAAGRKLSKAAHQAHEGWEEGARDDKAKHK